MTYPLLLQTTSCFALPGAKFSNVLTPTAESSFSASGPLDRHVGHVVGLVEEAADSRHARCSSRQFVNSLAYPGYT